MSILSAFRYQQQRHASFVRWTMWLVLLGVIVAGMPRWIVHAHTAGHESTLVVAMDGHTLDAHADDAGGPAEPNQDGTHLHGHYIVASSCLMPSMFTTVPGDALRAQSFPPGQVSPLREGHLAALHRPPIV